MQSIQNLARADKTAIEPLNPTDIFPLNRAAYATALAQSAFRSAYAPPSEAGFQDRTPDEIEAIRASVGLGTAT